MFGVLYGAIIGVLALAAGLLYRRRLTGGEGAVPRVTDDLIRRIEQEGAVEAEEPLDLETIREEEERFWNEPWDEPEEW